MGALRSARRPPPPAPRALSLLQWNNARVRRWASACHSGKRERGAHTVHSKKPSPHLLPPGGPTACAAGVRWSRDGGGAEACACATAVAAGLRAFSSSSIRSPSSSTRLRIVADMLSKRDDCDKA